MHAGTETSFTETRTQGMMVRKRQTEFEYKSSTCVCVKWCPQWNWFSDVSRGFTHNYRWVRMLRDPALLSKCHGWMIAGFWYMNTYVFTPFAFRQVTCMRGWVKAQWHSYDCVHQVNACPRSAPVAQLSGSYSLASFTTSKLQTHRNSLPEGWGYTGLFTRERHRWGHVKPYGEGCGHANVRGDQWTQSQSGSVHTYPAESSDFFFLLLNSITHVCNQKNWIGFFDCSL